MYFAEKIKRDGDIFGCAYFKHSQLGREEFINRGDIFVCHICSSVPGKELGGYKFSLLGDIVCFVIGCILRLID